MFVWFKKGILINQTNLRQLIPQDLSSKDWVKRLLVSSAKPEK